MYNGTNSLLRSKQKTVDEQNITRIELLAMALEFVCNADPDDINEAAKLTSLDIKV